MTKIINEFKRKFRSGGSITKMLRGGLTKALMQMVKRYGSRYAFDVLKRTKVANNPKTMPLKKEAWKSFNNELEPLRRHPVFEYLTPEEDILLTLSLDAVPAEALKDFLNELSISMGVSNGGRSSLSPAVKGIFNNIESRLADAELKHNDPSLYWFEQKQKFTDAARGRAQSRKELQDYKNGNWQWQDWTDYE